MPKSIPTDADIVRFVDEFTWMGGNPGGLASMLSQFDFDRATIESALSNVMSRHSCTSTYATALACKDILEAALVQAVN